MGSILTSDKRLNDDVVSNIKATLGEQLRSAARKWPDKTALIFEDQRFTFSDLEDRAMKMVGALQRIGLKESDRILIMLPNRPDFVIVWLAIGLGGFIEVPVNTDFRGQMLRYIIENSGADTLIIDNAYIDRLSLLAGEADLPLERILVVSGDSSSLPDEKYRHLETVLSESQSSGLIAQLPEVDERSPLGIMYTSGTTGPSKGAFISHRHAFEYARAVVDLLELEYEDTYYAPLPLFHIAGQWAVVYAAFQVGASVFLKERFSVSDFWSDVNDGNVTTSFLLGAMAQWLNGQPSKDDDAENPLSRVLMVPLIDELESFRDRFAVRVSTCYGSTEVNVPIVGDFDIVDPKSCGKAAPGFEVRLLDDNDTEVPVGQVGELCVRPSLPFTTMIEYHDRPEATVEAFRNLWLHSGDLMWRDEDGNFYFTDRATDSIRRRGENISSFEVEREVYAHPSVLECAVVAAPSASTEDDLVLVVIFREGAAVDETALRSFLDERLPRFMLPDRIVVIAEMPKTATGKIQKHVLRSRFQDGL